MLVSLRQMEESLVWMVNNLGATTSLVEAFKHIVELRGAWGNKVMELDNLLN